MATDSSCLRLLLTATLLSISRVFSQDYDVAEVQCTFAGSGGRDSISAKLRKPEGFRGSPLFADERHTDPLTDPVCQIRPETADPTQLSYRLLVTDFSRCGVLHRNGFVHVRVWFPQFPGVVMMSDQELIIMCKPPEPTIIENKAAGFAGSFPHGARVSGVVEETPGRLEYEVALYKEAPPARVGNMTGELPVDQAVPIGTKLQLRARISPDSAWKFVKLMEVAVSPDPDDPHVGGSVALVKDGCRNKDFATIIPHQPARYRDRNNEVFLDFEAFLLSTMQDRSTLWIHSQIKACMDAVDCQADYCLDLFEPSGHGRRRKRSDENKSAVNDTQSAKFSENIEYTVLMPADMYHGGDSSSAGSSCKSYLVLATLLGVLLLASALLMCYLASRVRAATASSASMDRVVRAHSRKTHLGSYTGRNTVQ